MDTAEHGVYFKEDNKYFNSKGILRSHIKSVHEKVKYPCIQCIKEFTLKSNRKKHIKSVHEKVKYPCKDSPNNEKAQPTDAADGKDF